MTRVYHLSVSSLRSYWQRLVFICVAFFLMMQSTTAQLSAPVISSFTPSSGPAGATVTISGSNFSQIPADNVVYFGAVKATVSTASSTSLSVIVPTGATYQPITVTANSYSAYSNHPFIVTAAPVVNAFSPTSFGEKIDINEPEHAKYISRGDFDGDGKPDLAVLYSVSHSSLSKFIIYRNTSTAGLFSFTPIVQWIGQMTVGIGVSDLNSDGLLDVVFGRPGFSYQTVAILINRSTSGNVQFAPEINIQTSISPYKVAFADFDQDGKTDIAITDEVTKKASVLQNTSVGTTLSFTETSPHVTGELPQSISTGDLDGDGKSDILVVNNNSNTISIFKNTGTGSVISFASKVDYVTGEGPYQACLGDLDGDQKPDIVISHKGHYTANPKFFSVLRNISAAGSVSFATRQDFSTDSISCGVSMTDFDGDAKPDIAISNFLHKVATFKNTSTPGNISFGRQISYTTQSFPEYILIGDLNGDSFPDLLAFTSNGFSILKNQTGIPASRFEPPVINSFTPLSGPIGSTVTITGREFSSIPANNIVYFGSVQAVVTAATSTSLQVTVPVGATYHPITVTRERLTAYTNKPFTTTFPNDNGPFTKEFFAPKADSITGRLPSHVAIADLNSDGKSDMIVVNKGANTVSVFRNTGAAGRLSFTSKKDIVVGRDPSSVATGDINGDGKMDLVVTSWGIDVLINTTTTGNDISFAKPVNLSLRDHLFVSVADLDLDGRPDLVASRDHGRVVSVYRNLANNDSIFFESVADYFAENAPNRVAIGDLTNDRRPELVVTNNGSHSVTVFWNGSSPGKIGFGSGKSFRVNGFPNYVSIGDLDNDGLSDLAVSSHSSVSVLRNISIGSNISFVNAIEFAAGSSIYANYFYSVSIGDLNGDGKADLATTNYLDSTLSILKNTGSSGSISFDRWAEYKTDAGTNHLAIGDLDNDGRPDAVVVNSGVNTISLLRNQANHPIIDSITPDRGTVGTTVTITGYNLSGATGIKFGGTAATSFTVVSTNTITAVTGEGSPGPVSVTTPAGTAYSKEFAFAAPVITSFSPASGPVGSMVTIKGSNFSVVAANNIVYFGAVRAQVLTATSTLLTVKVPAGATYELLTVSSYKLTAYSSMPFTVTFPGIGVVLTRASFSGKIDSFTGGQTNRVSIMDFDGDGKPDLAVAKNNSNLVSIFKNTGSGGKVSFATKIDFETSSMPEYISSVDIDGDGMRDILTSNDNSRGYGSVSILRNTSTATGISFAAKLDFFTSGSAYCVSVGDLDGDGRPDLAIATGSSSGVVVMRNTSIPGQISFAQAVSLGYSNNPRALAIGDLDGDNQADIVVSNSFTNYIAVYKNITANGIITFKLQQPLDLNSSPWGIVIADMNGDTKPDLVVGSAGFIGSSAVIAFTNLSAGGNISFSGGTSFSMDHIPYAVSIGDLDGDGKPDIAAGNNMSDSVSVFKNASIIKGAILFQKKANFQTGFDPYGTAIGDLNGDGKPELVAANRNSGSVSVLENRIGEPRVIPSGNNPVTGDIVKNVTLDSIVQTYLGSPFVQRHYDIEPLVSPSTATATVTLFFTQMEFNNYNAHPAHGLDLPKGPADNAGKANLRVYQYHGFSTNSFPGSYSGTAVEINPDDTNIVWNSITQWWEVTFDVNGFSGFFLGSEGNTILLVKVMSFTATIDGRNTLLEWVSKNESNVKEYEVERSLNGIDFVSVAKLAAKGNVNTSADYQHSDLETTFPLYYYRLKITYKDAKVIYSTTVTVNRMNADGGITAYPNPASGYVKVAHPLVSTNASLRVIDMTGKTVSLATVSKNTVETRMDLKKLLPGVYKVIFTEADKRFSQTLFVK